MSFCPGNGRSAAVLTANVVNSSPSTRVKLNGSPLAETNCTAMETQPLAHDASGLLTVPPM